MQFGIVCQRLATIKASPGWSYLLPVYMLETNGTKVISYKYDRLGRLLVILVETIQSVAGTGDQVLDI